MSSHELIPYLTVSLFFSFSAAFGILAMGMGFTKVGVVKGLGILDDCEESEDEYEVVVAEEVKEKKRKLRKQKSWDGVKAVEEPLPTLSPTLTLHLSRLSSITKTYAPHRLTLQHLPHSSPSSVLSHSSSKSKPLTSLALTRPLPCSSSSSSLTFLTSHPSLLANITTTSDLEGMEEMRKWIEWEMNVALTSRTAIPRRRVLGIWVSEEEEEGEGKTVILVFENWGTPLPASSWEQVPLPIKKKILNPSLHLLALGLDVCSLETENVLVRTDENGKVLEVRFRELQGLPSFEAGLDCIEGWRECIEKVDEWKDRLGIGEEED